MTTTPLTTFVGNLSPFRNLLPPDQDDLRRMVNLIGSSPRLGSRSLAAALRMSTTKAQSVLSRLTTQKRVTYCEVLCNGKHREYSLAEGVTWTPCLLDSVTS